MAKIVPNIVWTALPNGFDSKGRHKVSIFVSPRLVPTGAPGTGPGDSIDDYALGNWPQRVVDMAANRGSIMLAFDGLPPVPVDIDNASLLRTDIWDNIFQTGKLVRPHAFQDNAKRPMRSFSIRALNNYIHDLYVATANASAAEFPNLRAPTPLRELAVSMGQAINEIRRRQNKQTGHFIPPLPPPSDVATGQGGIHPDFAIEVAMNQHQVDLGSSVPLAEFFRAYRFYNRGQQEEYRSQLIPRDLSLIPEPLQPPDFDFHQVLAALGDHPPLLRMLGLIIDVTVTEATGPIPPSSTVKVASVKWGPDASPATDLTPSTNYYTKGSLFLPLPHKGGDIVDGMLGLRNPDLYGVIQSDIDGSALKTFDTGVTMHALLLQLPTLLPPDPCEHGTVPLLKPALQSLPALRNGGFTVFRVQRDAFLSSLLGDAASNNADIPKASLWAEDVMRGYRVDVGYRDKWYSLCWRKATYDIGDGAIPVDPGVPDEGYVKAATATSNLKEPPGPPPAAKDMYVHEALFGWENWSLVAARPGQTLAFERNDADKSQKLALKSFDNKPKGDFRIQLDAKIVPKTLPPLRFLEKYRFRARVVDLAGNSLDSFQDDAIPPGVTDSPFAFWHTSEFVYRRYEPVASPALVLRTKVTEGEAIERMVIRTRVGGSIPPFDGLFNPETDRHVAPPKTHQTMAELHGKFDDLWKTPKAAYDIAAREKGTFQDPSAGGVIINKDGNPDTPPPTLGGPWKSGDPLPEGWSVLQPGALATLPYLPDPLAIGAAFQGLPPGNIYKQMYSGLGSWPFLQPFRLELKSGSSIDVSSSFDVMTVTLPPATIHTVKVSSAMDLASMDTMSLWTQMSDAGRGNALSMGGIHWMITPWRELTFVHAVQKPLDKPHVVITDKDIFRNPGETFASITPVIHNHSHSTGLLDLYGSWTETVDRLHLKQKTMEDHRGRVLHRDVQYDEPVAKIPDPRLCEAARHEFGDTKHRWVQYNAIATTRYREYFPAALTRQLDLITVEGPKADVVNIPSSARPLPPKVVYIVPTFKWDSSTDKLTSTRVGRGLRIYLERPWYSSGDDELLGIIIAPDATSSADLRKKYMSEWGSDPVFSSAGPSATIKVGDFVDDGVDPITKPKVGHDLALAEMPTSGLAVTAVGYQPQYNDQRQLWYVDVELDPGSSYYPFIRFALARYQPYSVENLHLSRVVRTEFAQLVADRTATIGYGRAGIDVTVSGFASRNLLGAQLPFPVPPPVVTPVAPTPPGRTRRPLATGAPGAAPPVGPGPIVNPPPVGGIFISDPYAGAGRLVRARIERLDNPASTDLGWTQVGAEVVLPPYTILFAPNEIFWRGSVPTPTGFGTDGKTYRLVVHEVELFETDDEVQETGLPVFTAGRVVRERPVYLDTFTLAP